jgi:hypothetical protein
MMSITFVVDFFDGRWRVNVDGEWYGSFPSHGSAELAAVELARATPNLASRVIVRQRDGSEAVVWDPPQLVNKLCQCLCGHVCNAHEHPIDGDALREEIARRVAECAKYELSEEDVIDVILASFGLRRRVSFH